ncbi:MAG: hemolysin III family protein [Clostridia bacterium]
MNHTDDKEDPLGSEEKQRILEERLNVLTHGIGVVLSIVALIFLVSFSLLNGGYKSLAGSVVFGISLVTLYMASSLYHSCKKPKAKETFQIIDHSAIYVLIAGSYTPYALLVLEGRTGWALLGIVWGLAILGILFKSFFVEKMKILSTLAYVFMGWIAIFVYRQLAESLPLPGMVLLFAGGISYTLGAIFFGIRRMPLNHAVFHLFVLGGSICHFLSIYLYVLPLGIGR